MRISISLRMAALAASFFAAVGAAYANDNGVWIGTTASGSRQIEIAVADMATPGDDKDELGKKTAGMINFDLKSTGFFKPQENREFVRQAVEKDLSAPGGVAYAEWKTLAANFLVKGNMGFNPDGSIFMDTRVYDLQAKKIYFSKIYSAPKPLFRQMVHQFSDDLLNRLTGETGVSRSKIVFVSRQNGKKELFTMDYDGNNPTQVTSDRSLALFPNYHPFKDMALFTTYRYRNPDLYAIDINTGARYPVSRKVGANMTGKWSPDGQKIAFALTHAGSSDIYICDADGKNTIQLTSWPSIETSPAFSPDGKHIAYTSDRTGMPQIYVMSVDGKDNKRATWTGSYNDTAAWSPKGDYIAYASMTGSNFNIALVNVNESRDVRQLTSGSGSEETPTWSPNGRNIAYSGNSGGVKQIFIMNADGTNQTQITNLPGGGYSPSWGPAPTAK
ncbi:MAG: Tol-Pal system beta propeller repeat protein TolB [Nitrospinae bacterium]|nr:Tol-Pal system beta propeller repeat protein TolB [Nitrospinota bacterium]